MPLYEYQCAACGQRFEVIQKFSDPPPEVCTKCGKGPVTRLMSSPAIQFKGTGWYITDYAQKGKSGGASEGKSDGKSEGKKDAAEGKSESRSEEKSGSAATESTSKSTDGGTKPASTSSSKE